MADILTLAWLCFQVGLFTFGGGAAMVPLISQNLVSAHFLTAQEAQDMVSLSQMTPGPFAINAATFAGMKIGGLPGALAATIGMALPSILITLLVARFFFAYSKKPIVSGVLSGIRPVVLAMIAGFVYFFGTGVFISNGSPDLPLLLMALGTFLLARFTKISPALLLTAAAGLGIVLYA